MSNPMRLGLLAAAVAVIVVGFVLASSTSDDADDPERAASAVSTSATAPAPATTQGEPAAEPATQTVVVQGAEPRGGVRRLRFVKGEQVRFRVRSDVADEIHVHGYDQSKDIEAGGSVTFTFPAKIDGRFEVELEKRGVEIAQLEVQP